MYIYSQAVYCTVAFKFKSAFKYLKAKILLDVVLVLKMFLAAVLMPFTVAYDVMSCHCKASIMVISDDSDDNNCNNCDNQ